MRAFYAIYCCLKRGKSYWSIVIGEENEVIEHRTSNIEHPTLNIEVQENEEATSLRQGHLSPKVPLKNRLSCSDFPKERGRPAHYLK